MAAPSHAHTPDMAGVFRCVAFLVFLLGLAAPLFSLDLIPPDTRSWEQVTADFVSREPHLANSSGEGDGRRLKELDPKRAADFLMPFLAKENPQLLRLKAIGALGWSSTKAAIPALSAIANDETEDERVRSDALNPGLIYMKSPAAVKTATTLATHKSIMIRTSAYGVLGRHGTDKAVEVLENLLRANEEPARASLIGALGGSNHRRGGRIVFENCRFAEMLDDEQLLRAYSRAMLKYRIPEAQANMLIVVRQHGHPLSAYYALLYFGSFPREDVVPSLIKYLESDTTVRELYETVMRFMKSRRITADSKKKLSALIVAGKVPPRRPHGR
jgi:HEAT repeat protein